MQRNIPAVRGRYYAALFVAAHQTEFDPKRLSAPIVKSVASASVADMDYNLAMTHNSLAKQIVSRGLESQVIDNSDGSFTIGVSLGDFPIHGPVGQEND